MNRTITNLFLGMSAGIILGIVAAISINVGYEMGCKDTMDEYNIVAIDAEFEEVDWLASITD